MAMRLFARALPLLLAFFAPALLAGQFQKPTDEELKMTADPAYPDAAAVYLYRESKADDTLHYQSEYVRIKVLKELGRELATVNLGYLRGISKIEGIEGRTIHADGTVIPLNVKAEDLLQVKQGDTELHQVVFNLPSVEVGSILEYYYRVSYDPNHFSTPRWEIQQEFPVRKAHFSFIAYPDFFGGGVGMRSNRMVNYRGDTLTDLMWSVNLPNGKILAPDGRGHFNLEVTDIPPLPSEPWMPPIDSQRYQVTFYYTPGKSGVDYWLNESSYWLKEMNRFAAIAPAIKEAATSIAAPAGNDLDKARKLYAAVQALDNTDFSRVKSKDELKQQGLKQAKRAEDTWAQKGGCGQDIALLYLALLRAAGITAYPMKVVNRDRAIFNQDYLEFGQLNDVIVIASIDNKEIVLDPGEKMCPFQMVHWKHAGAGGVRQSEKGVAPWVTPLLPYNSNTITRRADLAVNADGSVTGKLQFGLTGQDALLWRQRALTFDETALYGQFEQWISSQLPAGVEAHLVKMLRLDEPDSELTAVATVSGVPGSAAGKRLLLPALFFSNYEDRAFIEQPHRSQPVDMHYAQQIKDGVLYHLPGTYAVESIPPAATIPWPNNAALLIKSSTSRGEVTLTRSLARAFTLIPADEYASVRDFYQKVAAAGQQQLVLLTDQAAKGN